MHLLIVGGSDGGIAAALRARELASDVDVTVLVADAYPNYSICGLPYHLSGDVPNCHDLAHRTVGDLEQTGMRLLLNHTARAIDPALSRSPSPTGRAPASSRILRRSRSRRSVGDPEDTPGARTVGVGRGLPASA